MHVPEHMLQGAVCPVTAVVSVTAVTAAVWATKNKDKPKALFFAAVTAFIFAAQMLNFPVQNGTSGHLVGATLAAFFLDVPFAVLSMSFVLLIQTLFFGDGGLTVLGVNILNMAVIGVLPFAFLQAWQQRHQKNNSTLSSSDSHAQKLSPFLLGLSAWLSVVLAAAVLSLELASEGIVSASKVFPAMLGVHALIGVGEASLTLLAVYALKLNFLRSPEHSSQKWSYGFFLLAAVLMAFLLSPFASSFPDGLEWVAEKYNFLYEQAPSFTTWLADYQFATLTHPFWSTAIAGLAGVGISFVFAFLAVKILSLMPVKISRKS